MTIETPPDPLAGKRVLFGEEHKFKGDDGEPDTVIAYSLYEQNPTTLQYPMQIRTEFGEMKATAVFAIDGVEFERGKGTSPTETKRWLRRKAISLAGTLVKDLSKQS